MRYTNNNRTRTNRDVKRLTVGDADGVRVLLGIKDGTPDTEGASLGTVLGFALIDGNPLGIKDGTPEAEGASLGWGRCVW